METQIIKIIQNSDDKSFLFYGGWGIGKTFLFKKISENINKNNLVKDTIAIYFDVRGIDIYPDYLSILSLLFDSANDKENIKKIFSFTTNTAIWLLNGILKTSFAKIDFSKKSEANIAAISKKIKNKKFLLFLDEFDRVDGNSILKILNFVNIIKFSNIDVKTICIGNKREMERVLYKSFGDINNEKYRLKSFLYKYFDQEISIDKIQYNSIKQILQDKKEIKLLDFFVSINTSNVNWGTNLSARGIFKFLQKIKIIRPFMNDTFLILVFLKYFIDDEVFEINLFSNGIQINSHVVNMITKNPTLFDKPISWRKPSIHSLSHNYKESNDIETFSKSLENDFELANWLLQKINLESIKTYGKEKDIDVEKILMFLKEV